MKIYNFIKNSPFLKDLAHRLLIPKGQARPRLWVKWFVLPFSIKKGKGACIRKYVRFDVFPFNKFFLGQDSTIEDFCTINNASGFVQIGNRTRIGIGSVLIGPVTIGDDVRLAQNVVVTAINHNYTDVTKPISEQGITTNEIYIGDETWLGSNSVVLPGIFIGKHCIVAAGSVVTKNVPSYSMVVGNPARIIKKYDFEKEAWELVRH
jgi:acetyltransferase-like isoleucine patch superfamily enzyme